MDTFERELEKLINRFSRENASDTPDFILASFMNECLSAWNSAIQQREAWFGRGEQLCKPAEESHE